jgi:hypothetical protein
MLSIKDVRKITDIEADNIPVFKAIHTIKKGYISCDTWRRILAL